MVLLPDSEHQAFFYPQVKFYIGVDEKSDDEEPSKSNCWEHMCHPLCQCDRCASIQKVRQTDVQSIKQYLRKILFGIHG